MDFVFYLNIKQKQFKNNLYCKIKVRFFMDKDLVLQNLKGYFDYFRSIYNVEKLQKEKEEREKKILKCNLTL